MVLARTTAAPLRYHLSFSAAEPQQFHLVAEHIEEADQPVAKISAVGEPRPGYAVTPDDSNPKAARQTASLLAQPNDPEQYSDLAWVSKAFAEIRVYRDWHFGQGTIPRLPQQTNQSATQLAPDASNLALVLSHLASEPNIKQQLLEALHDLYANIDDFEVRVEDGVVRLYFYEHNAIIPAVRLSDGTLRYLCLLAILCNPDPGMLVCIEEPELGLHPDVLSTLADLIIAAARRTQLIITTHSDILLDAFHDQPEVIVVTERDQKGTHLKRVAPDEIKTWLAQERLGLVWMSGGIGGTRW